MSGRFVLIIFDHNMLKSDIMEVVCFSQVLPVSVKGVLSFDQFTPVKQIIAP